MRSINLIVIHCSASPNGQTLFSGLADGTGLQRTPVKTIDNWHHDRGFRRSEAWRQQFNPDLFSIGYHFVIYRNGAIASGRHVDEVGAHVEGFNQQSIGVCLVGMDQFTDVQWRALADHIAALKKKYPNAQVVGHRDLPNAHKDCPCFDVATWLRGGMAALADHLAQE